MESFVGIGYFTIFIFENGYYSAYLQDVIYASGKNDIYNKKISKSESKKN